MTSWVGGCVQCSGDMGMWFGYCQLLESERKLERESKRESIIWVAID